jgi:hypothetical protein
MSHCIINESWNGFMDKLMEIVFHIVELRRKKWRYMNILTLVWSSQEMWGGSFFKIPFQTFVGWLIQTKT